MDNALSLTCKVNTPYLPASKQPRLLYLLLEVGGGGGDEVLPVNLSIVVDTSASMRIRLVTEGQFKELAQIGALEEKLVDGVPVWQSVDIPRDVMARLPRKIDRVADALRVAVEHLRPADSFSLVAFAGQATTLIPNTSGSQKRRLLEIIEGLDDIRLGDETYIAKGIALGFEELRLNLQQADRLLVLTDGFAFDEEECRAWATRARQNRVPISTMGLGGDFNEELMIPIADQTGGEAYLLEDADDIPVAFAQELQRAQAVRYRNLEVKLRPSQGVEVRAAYRVRPSIAPLEIANDARGNRVGSYSFPLGDLVTGDEPALLLEMIAPPRSPGTYRLAQALMAYDNPAGGPMGVKVRSDVVVHYTSDPAQAVQIEPQVMHIVEALSAYKLQQRASADLDSGDVESATRKLRAAATRLLDMGEDDLAAEMEEQARELEQRGQADPRRTKKLRYETRKLTQKLME